jgi:hypothetical protein|tara:strand:+ start:790 stop:1077 length:288 start_codon:yes stop_codon:yes gene_type:complete
MSDNTQTSKSSEWRERELGALWSQKGKSKEYMTGHFSIGDERHKVVVFKNQNKTSDRAPDFVIYKHVERNGDVPQTASAVSDSEGVETEIPDLLV